MLSPLPVILVGVNGYAARILDMVMRSDEEVLRTSKSSGDKPSEHRNSLAYGRSLPRASITGFHPGLLRLGFQ
jgi:hypothetical protein